MLQIRLQFDCTILPGDQEHGSHDPGRPKNQALLHREKQWISGGT